MIFLRSSCGRVMSTLQCVFRRLCRTWRWNPLGACACAHLAFQPKQPSEL